MDRRRFSEIVEDQEDLISKMKQVSSELDGIDSPSRQYWKIKEAIDEMKYFVEAVEREHDEDESQRERQRSMAEETRDDSRDDWGR